MIITTTIEYDDDDFTSKQAFSLASEALRRHQREGKTFVTLVSAFQDRPNAVVEIIGNKYIVRKGAEKTK